MTSVEITLKDGTIRRFPHEGRPGGSYTKTVRYEGAFVIVRDEWGQDTAIPVADVKEVRTWPTRGW